MNPVYLLMVNLLRLQYGDALDYADGGPGGLFASRAEAAIALLDGGHVEKVSEYAYQVRSQEAGKVRYYMVHLGEPVDCECEDFQVRRALCKHCASVLMLAAMQATFRTMDVQVEQQTELLFGGT